LNIDNKISALPVMAIHTAVA